jgi:WD40 repeat protein/transcriptional regulator with XRE-family HTH domain
VLLQGTAHRNTEGRGFRSLLLLLRGRAAMTQRELANAVGVSERSVQVWEAGGGFPSAPTLQRLIALYVQLGVLSRQADEAGELWAAAVDDGSRFKAPFDAAWFASVSETLPAARRDDWGEAPAVSVFYGRENERRLLANDLTADDCRLVGVLGMGGIGKTALIARVAQSVRSEFDVLFWRSVRSAPPCADWLAAAILFLSEQNAIPPPGEEERRRLLLELLQDRRCLVVLDNMETLLEPGACEVRYRDDYEGYGTVLQSLGETSHQSCVVVTSREAPPELRRLDGRGGPVRALHLEGLDESAGRALLATKGLEGAPESWSALVERYRGNALALQVVGETIASVFGRSIDAFLSAGEAVFGDIRRLLESQLSRLSATERAVLYWLAIEREAVGFDTLAADLGAAVPRHDVLEALEALHHRSLLEMHDEERTFALQPVVLEHVTEEIISSAYSEITDRQPSLLKTHALVKAQSLEYVRRSQERLIAAPLLDRLSASGNRSCVEPLLLDLLGMWRGSPDLEQGYGPGNIVNLLRLARGHLRGLDLSDLWLRQVDFAAVDAQDTCLARARVRDAVFATQFGSAMSVMLSADGSSLIVGTLTGEVRVWRLADRTPLMLEHQPTGAAWDVAISADGTVSASCGADATVVWSTRVGQDPIVLRTEGRELWRVALSADGQVLATGAADGTTCLWDARTGVCLAELECHVGGVRGLALSATGHLLATGGPDGAVRAWDTATGACLGEFSGVSGEARSLAMSSDGALLACGDAEATVHVWDVRTGQKAWTLHGHTGPVWATALTADGRFLASGGADRTVRIWDTRVGECQWILADHTSRIIGVSISGDGRLAASVAADGVVQMRDVRRGHCVGLVRGSVPALFEVAVSADAAYVVSGGGDGNVRLWDARVGGHARVLTGHTDGVWSVALTRDGQLAASGGLDGTARLWNGSTGECVAVLRGHTASVWSVALSADGTLLASGGLDGTFRLWNTVTHECLRAHRCDVAGVRTVRLSADGRTLVTAEFDGTVRIWNTETVECLGTLRSPHSEAGRLAVSADGRIVAYADMTGQVRLWDTLGLTCVRVIQAQRSGVRGVGLSADAAVLATGGVDGSIGLWNVADGQPRGLLRGHFGEVWDVTLNADGSTAVSGGLDGTVRLWDTRGSGTEIRTMRNDRPYERTDITGIDGLTDAQRSALIALGAVESATTIIKS